MVKFDRKLEEKDQVSSSLLFLSNGLRYWRVWCGLGEIANIRIKLDQQVCIIGQSQLRERGYNNNTVSGRSCCGRGDSFIRRAIVLNAQRRDFVQSINQLPAGLPPTVGGEVHV